MSKHPVIIDCDPGIDDAVALALAFSVPDELDVLAITTVAGNVPLQLTERNARILRELAGRGDVPVFAGCPQPMVRAPVFADDFHGEDGLGGVASFTPKKALGEGHAVLKIVELIRAAPRPVQLIATGPLTNIAAALLLAPDIGENILELVVMGGADSAGGNITPHAEFNFYADPHAAQLVFEKQIGADHKFPIVLFSLDFTHTVRNTPERIAAVRASGGALSEVTADFLEAINAFELKMVGSGTGPLHDPCTIAYALSPDLFRGRAGSVRINTKRGDHFGQSTFIDEGQRVTWIANDSIETSDAIFDLLTKRLGKNG